MGASKVQYHSKNNSSVLLSIYVTDDFKFFKNHIKAPKEELTRPSFSRPVKTEAQRDPKAGPSYLEKLKHKSSLGSSDNSGKTKF